LLLGACVALTELLPPSQTDPLPLRWLRILVAHPGRSLLALTLVAWSIGPHPRPPATPSEP
jgi:hypothetical protein